MAQITTTNAIANSISGGTTAASGMTTRGKYTFEINSALFVVESEVRSNAWVK